MEREGVSRPYIGVKSNRVIKHDFGLRGPQPSGVIGWPARLSVNSHQAIQFEASKPIIAADKVCLMLGQGSSSDIAAKLKPPARRSLQMWQDINIVGDVRFLLLRI